MSKKQNLKEEREDFLAKNISRWMKFQVTEKNKLSRKDLDGDGIEVTWVKHFRFKRDDIIVVENETERSITFHVERDGKKVKNDNKNLIRFEFSKLIFVKAFENFTDLDNVIDNVTDAIAWEIWAIITKKDV